MLHKTMTGTKAEGDSGEVRAVFSTFNVIDHDGDVTLPDAFEDGAPVRISAYNHASWGSALPVGRGVIKVESDRAVLEGRFFMNTQHGRDTFETVKEMDDLGEWSYGYDVLASHPGEFEGQQVQFLEKLKVHEVSPVLLGAGIGTETLSVKSLDDMSDEECAEQAKEACLVLLKRGIELPHEIVEAVRQKDAEAKEAKSRLDSLRFIAAVNGITIPGGQN